MKKLLNYIAISSISFALTLLLSRFVMPAAVDTFSIKGVENLAQLSPILHFSYNSYLSWSIDPSVVELGKLLHRIFGEGMVATPALLLLSLLSAGLCSLLYFLGYRYLTVLTFPTLFAICLLLVFGADHLLLGSVAWFFYFVLAVLISIRDKRSSLVGMALLGITVMLIARSALHFSLFFIGSGLLLSISLQKAFLSPSKLEKKLQKAIISFLLFLPVITSIALHEEFSGPRFPESAHLVTDDNVPGNLVPLVGEVSSVPFINREFVRELFSCPAAVLFLLTIALYFASRFAFKNKEASVLLLFPAACFSLVLLDTKLSEAFAQIMPLYTLARIVPGASFYPLDSFALFFGIAGLFFGILKLSPKLLASVLICSMLGLVTFNYKTERVVLEKSGNRALAASIVALGEWLEPEQRAVFFSPSYNVLVSEGLGVLLHKERYRQLNFSYSDDLAESKEADINPAEVFDQNLATRWNKKGGQRGSEELCLSFKKEVALSGIELGVGNFASDFPRGVEVLKVKDCADKKGEVLYRRSRWEGPVMFTAEGFPYWGWQGDVKLLFARDALVQNLKVRQIGNEPAFDWSVAEVKFLLVKQADTTLSPKERKQSK